MKKANLLLCLFIVLLSCTDDVSIENDSKSSNHVPLEFLRSLDNTSLQDLALLDRMGQIGAVNNISPYRMRELWLEKFDLMIAAEQDQSYVTKLIELKNFVNGFSFEREFNVSEEIYLNNFFNISKSQFNKDDLYMTINFSSFEVYNGNQNYRYLSVSEIVAAPGESPGCNCRWGVCDAAGAFTCKEKECNKSSSGCGFLFWQSCVKMCKMS